MIAHKFLGTGAIGLYSGFSWPTPAMAGPGPWVAVDGPLVEGRNFAGTPSPGSVAANLGFVAAHICGYVAGVGGSPEAYDAGFQAERDRQTSWLRRRLQLAE